MRKFEIQSPGLDPTLMREEVVLTVNGKDHLLCFDMAAIAQVQRETNIDLLVASLSEFDAVTLPILLLASLRKAEPELTLPEVQSWITIKNFPIIGAAVTAAWFESSATSEGETGKRKGQTRKGKPLAN